MTTPKHPATARAHEARSAAAPAPTPTVGAQGVVAPVPAPPAEHEEVPGYHVIHYENQLRYVSDHDGYQTAYAEEARAYERSHGR